MPPTGTGARETALRFYEAVGENDWEAAYTNLHPDTKKRLDQPAFEARARAFQKRLGFRLEKVIVRSCDEGPNEAIAQLVLSDADGSPKHRHREGVVLRPTSDGWRVVLPANFGQP